MSKVEELWNLYKNDTGSHSVVERFLVRLRDTFPKNEVANYFNQWAELVGMSKESDLYIYLKAKLLDLY